MTQDDINDILATVDFRRFHNGLRILRALDQHEVDALAVDWPRFRDDPFMYFIGCNDEAKAVIWRALERRQPEELRSDAART